jgi:hypothetical protein
MWVAFSRRLLGACLLTWGTCCCAATGVFALSGGRVYEMVSPVYKAGYGINKIVAVAPDGENVVFPSIGSFAGDPASNVLVNTYDARRGSSGWSTVPLTPPAALIPYGGPIDYSTTLESSLTEGKPGPNMGSALYDGTIFEYLLHRTDLPDTAPNAGEPAPNFEVVVPNPAPNFEMAGEPLETRTKKPFTLGYQGASADFSHILFEASYGDYLLPAAVNTRSSLYDLISHPVSGEPPLRLVGLNNKGKVINPACLTVLGSSAGKGSSFNAVAAGGKAIFFNTEVDGACAVPQLFVRLGGERTLEVSRPVSPKCTEVPCTGAETRAPAEFQGANEDGSKIFFTTTAPLEPATDKDTGNDLYMARIECPGGETEACEATHREVKQMVQVSHGAEPAEVQDVVTVAPDGSRVYFVARGVLSAGLNTEEHAPVKGADNLYVYDSITGGPPVFIGDLCSGPEELGVVEDPHCPSSLNGQRNDTSLWATAAPEARLNVCARPSAGECTGDRETGRFLVFSSYAQLIEGSAEGDTDNAKDVYRYDAQTGTLKRVSLGEDGSHENGNGNDSANCACDASIAKNQEYHYVYFQHDMNSRAISEDGSRIVFTTAELLSPAVSNGLSNAYEWHEGGVSLVSGGSATRPVENVVISSSGRDVFLETTQSLVPQDTDGQEDVYDARIEGGFPPAPAEREPCKGDACYGPLTNPAPLLVPGSVPQTPGENLPPLKKATPKKLTPAQQLTRALKACAKKPKSKRTACRRSAQKKYAKASKQAGRGRR